MTACATWMTDDDAFCHHRSFRSCLIDGIFNFVRHGDKHGPTNPEDFSCRRSGDGAQTLRTPDALILILAFLRL